MKTTQLYSLTSGLLAISLFLSGCSSEPPPVSDVPAVSNHDADEEHAAGGEQETAEHSHGAGPHGGTIVDWGGGEYHVELTVDHDKQQATVYVLGADAKAAAPVKAADEQILLTIREPSFQVELSADPQPEDPPGTSSRYVGQHEQLGTVQEFAGTISAAVDGTPYAGEFSEEAHEH